MFAARHRLQDFTPYLVKLHAFLQNLGVGARTRALVQNSGYTPFRHALIPYPRFYASGDMNDEARA